jgi:hypothetical protein
MILQEKKQQINLNFELALNNSVTWHRIKAGIAFGDCSPAGFQTRGTYVLKVWVLFLAEFRCSRLMFWRKVGGRAYVGLSSLMRSEGSVN